MILSNLQYAQIVPGQESLKHRLIREAGSRSNDIVISALEWLDREGWLTGEYGLLNGADLREARSQDASLDEANLQNAKLSKTNSRSAILKEAKFLETNLQNAD